MTGHICGHPEVIIEKGDFGPDDPLQAGMAVLIPCPECGETPHDSLELMHRHAEELQASLLAQEPNRPLYHWSPRSRRKQIERYGFRPHMRPTTTSDEDRRVPYVCFGDTPSWSWSLSGGLKWTPAGEWDLWQTWLEALESPVVLSTPDRPSGIYEVRTEHRVFKRDIWWVGSRVKT